VASSGSPDDDPVLVGRSHECDHPPYVTRHPILTSAKNKFESCSQMNEAVGSSLAVGDSLYDVDAKLLQVNFVPHYPACMLMLQTPLPPPISPRTGDHCLYTSSP
jgi:hypothetical protein